MAFDIAVVTSPGRTLSVTIERLSPGAVNYFFNPNAFPPAFENGVGLLYTQKKIPLVEGTLEYVGRYTASISGLNGVAGTDPPVLVRACIHDEGASNQTIAAIESYAIGGSRVRIDQFTTALATPADVSEKILEALTADITIDDLTQLPLGSPTISQIAAMLWMSIRNRSQSTDSAYQLFDKDGVARFEAAISQDDQTTVRGELENTTT